MIVSADPIEDRFRGESWSLDIREDRIILRNARRTPVREFSASEAVECIHLPIFVTDSGNYVGITLNNSRVQFGVDAPGRKMLKEFLQRAMPFARPEALQALKKLAVRETFGGLALFVGSVSLTVVSHLAAMSREGNTYMVYYGATGFGIVAFLKGLNDFKVYFQTQRLIRETQGEEEILTFD